MRLIGAASAVLLGATACSDGVHGQVADQRATWEAHEPDRYVVQTCTLGIEPPGCVREAVDGERVVMAEERVFCPSVPWWEPIDLQRKSLDAMFDRASAPEADEDGCTLDEVRYDEDLGYVTEYTLDCEGSVIGGRWVACFEPDEQDLSACEVEP